MNLDIDSRAAFLRDMWLCGFFSETARKPLWMHVTLGHHMLCLHHNLNASGTLTHKRVSRARLWRRTRCAHHKRRLQALSQCGGALTANTVRVEVQLCQCLIILVIFQPMVTRPGAQIAARTLSVVFVLGKKRDGDGRCPDDRCTLVFSCADTTSHFNS